MDIVFNSYTSSVEEYDRILTETGMLLNQASWEYEGFIIDLLNRFPSKELLCEVEIPVLGSEGYVIDTVSRIYRDQDDAVKISLSGGDIIWNELNISAQDYLCQNIFMEIKKYDVAGSLFPQTPEQEP